MLPLTAYTKVYGPLKVMTPEGRSLTDWYKYRSGFRQRLPYTIDTPCSMNEYTREFGWTDADSWGWGPDNWQFPTLEKAVIDMRNRARARFVAKLGDTSSFGATFTAERRETWATVVGTITRAGLAAKHVSRMQFGQAARVLGLPYRERTIRTVRYRGKPPSIHSKKRKRAYVSRQRVMSFGSGREVLKTLANGWLMWSYGVKPLMSDIFNGMDVLQRPCPEQRISASARTTAKVVDETGTEHMGSRYEYQVTGSIRVSAFVRVNNPNLWLANQLGLVNPMQWLNEAIPFSFVVDWFSNLSQVISQMTDFVGLDVIRPCTTQMINCREAGTVWRPWPTNPPYAKNHRRFTRELEVPRAQLLFAYERFEWQRGLNAISLLVGFLPKKSALS